MDTLPLGVHHWRYQFTLTELLPQPFPPIDPSFAAQIPINYRVRLHQQEEIKGYTKQELVLQDHYHYVLGFLTLVNTTVDLPRPEEISKHDAPLWSAHPKLSNDTTGVAIMSFLCAQNFSQQDLSNDTALHQIKLNSTSDSDANVKKGQYLWHQFMQTYILHYLREILTSEQQINFITEQKMVVLLRVWPVSIFHFPFF
jgi:hypothetical protein